MVRPSELLFTVRSERLSVAASGAEKSATPFIVRPVLSEYLKLNRTVFFCRRDLACPLPDRFGILVLFLRSEATRLSQHADFDLELNEYTSRYH